ncbi:MAG TPA: IS110 family transposase [Treponemataceae bacterium]|nr:IS110 family transposase [Treponemataceae bacterium]
MIYVGIDVAKDKHDCIILNSDGKVVFDVFTIQNNIDGFEDLLFKIKTTEKCPDKVKVGLEATGHYSCNILGFLKNKGLSTIVINPLYTSLSRKSISLRKTKTDKVDARTIACMIMSDVNLKPYSDTLYLNEDLKSLTRYRFNKVAQRAKLKQSVSRLVNILFPELEKLVSTLHGKAVYELLSEFPSAQHIASANLKHLTNLLHTASKGRFQRASADEIRQAARKSIGSYLPAKSLELKHTIKLIRELNSEITEIEAEIKKIMDVIDSPIISIPGIGQNLGAVILAEIGDFSRFESPDKILAFAGCSPSTYQSGQLYSSHAKMEKRGSRYLRWALLNAAAYVCKWEPTFATYLAKKLAEGKHYYVALSHAAKKLVRVLYHLETTGKTYQPTSILS